MDIIAGLQAFLRVAKPRLIGVTQPVIPKQVSGLEQRLADRLVHRSTLAVTLTGEGREVIRSSQLPPRRYHGCSDATYE
jgi:DNA-binding transcriptional LysR family regulator